MINDQLDQYIDDATAVTDWDRVMAVVSALDPAQAQARRSRGLPPATYHPTTWPPHCN